MHSGASAWAGTQDEYMSYTIDLSCTHTHVLCVRVWMQSCHLTVFSRRSCDTALDIWVFTQIFSGIYCFCLFFSDFSFWSAHLQSATSNHVRTIFFPPLPQKSRTRMSSGPALQQPVRFEQPLLFHLRKQEKTQITHVFVTSCSRKNRRGVCGSWHCCVGCVLKNRK